MTFSLLNWRVCLWKICSFNHFSLSYAESPFYADKLETIEALEGNGRRVIADIRTQLQL